MNRKLHKKILRYSTGVAYIFLANTRKNTFIIDIEVVSLEKSDCFQLLSKLW